MQFCLNDREHPVLERNRVLCGIYEAGVIRLPSGEVQRVDENGMPRAAGARLYDLVCQERPSTTLEVGMAFGLSTLSICQALAECGGDRHIVMDPNQESDFGRAGLRHLEEAGLRHLVEFHEESSHRILPLLEATGTELDFAFVDGVHLFDYTLLEFFYIDRMLRPGALIVFDDLQLPAIRKVVRYAVTNRGYRDESRSARTGRLRRTGRAVKRIARGLRALPTAVGYTVGGERRELLAVEIGWPRELGLGVLRKVRNDDRSWKHHVEF
jgi:predicted O-methyltransferase YrrM